MRSSSKKSPLSWRSWQNFPEFIFSDLVIIVGRESLEDLRKCRQVCKAWNVMIKDKYVMTTPRKNTIRRRADFLAANIREKWRWTVDLDTPHIHLPEITIASSLAHHDLLGSVECMSLINVDLASVPTGHLASLASCVTEEIEIDNVENLDLLQILSNIQCNSLSISNQSLGREELNALVRTMESTVTYLSLQDNHVKNSNNSDDGTMAQENDSSSWYKKCCSIL